LKFNLSLTHRGEVKSQLIIQLKVRWQLFCKILKIQGVQYSTVQYSTVQYSTDFTTVQVHFSLGTGHNLAGGVGRWKQWGGGGGGGIIFPGYGKAGSQNIIP
jgi:hypothetical protein